MSNGAIYHAVGSRDGLVARVWSREADTFLAHQRDVITSSADPIEALVGVACTPADFAHHHPEGSTILLSVRPEQLLTDRLTQDDHRRVSDKKRELSAIVEDLAEVLWGRRDRTALALVTMCVVDLPRALLLARGRMADPVARHALEVAVRALATTPVPA